MDGGQNAAGERLEKPGGLHDRAEHHGGQDEPHGRQHVRHAAPAEQLVERAITGFEHEPVE